MEPKEEFKAHQIRVDKVDKEQIDGETMADYFIKILLLGNMAVGKCSLISSYAHREFPKNIIGTGGMDHSVKDIML